MRKKGEWFTIQRGWELEPGDLVREGSMAPEAYCVIGFAVVGQTPITLVKQKIVEDTFQNSAWQLFIPVEDEREGRYTESPLPDLPPPEVVESTDAFVDMVYNGLMYRWSPEGGGFEECVRGEGEDEWINRLKNPTVESNVVWSFFTATVVKELKDYES